MKKRLLGAALIAGISAQAALLTTDFDSLSAGSVTAADLSGVTTGGAWSTHWSNGHVYSMDGTVDKAFKVYDGSYKGKQAFATLTLDAAASYAGETITLSTRTAPNTSYSNKGLLYEFLDENGIVAASIRWWGNNTVSFNGGDSTALAFDHDSAWDPASLNVKNLSVIFNGAQVSFDFGGVQSGSLALMNGANSTLKSMVVSGDSAAWTAQGAFIDDVSVIPEPATLGLVTAAGGGILVLRRFMQM